MTKIGLAYINGADPGFEDLGCLPTDIVKENGLVNGNKAIDIREVFYNCSQLSNLPDISNWNLENVQKAERMFCKCTLLSSLPDISK